MAKPAVLTMISEASSPIVSNAFVNNHSEICTLQISGTFTSATVNVEGIVNVNSGRWVNLATFDLSDLDLKTNGMSDNSIYQVGIAGILRIRVSVSAITGGNITVMANFVGSSFAGEELPPSSEIPFTAYDFAVLGGYTGTQSSYEKALANVVNVGPLAQLAVDSAEDAEEAAARATNAATDAESSANDARNAVNTIAPEIVSEVTTEWLNDNVNPVGSAVVVDSSLTISGAAADAKQTGDDINELKNDIAVTKSFLLTNSNAWQQGTFNTQGTYTDRVRAGTSDTRIITASRTPINEGDIISFLCPAGYKYRAFFSAIIGNITIGTSYIVIDDGYDDVSTWFTTDRNITAPIGSKSFFMAIAKADDSEISPNNKPQFDIYVKTNGARIAENSEAIADIETGYAAKEKNATWGQGYYSVNGSATIVSSTTRCYTSNIIYNEDESKYIKVKCQFNMKARITFWNNYTRSSTSLIKTAFNSSWKDNGILCAIPAESKTYGVSVAYVDNSTITPENCQSVEIIEYTNNPKYDGLTISILGDSISTFAGDNAESASDNHLIADGTYTYAGNHCRYPNDYLKNVNNTYWKRLINTLGLRFGVNDSWAGSLVSWNGTESSDVGANIYIASQTRIDHLGLNGYPNIILVNAGTNDIGKSVTIGTFDTESPVNYTDEQIASLPVNNFADAYRALLIRLQKTYPLAKIIVMLPDYTTSYYNPTNADKYIEIIKEACDFFGVPWVDMRSTGINMYNTGIYLGDGIHPNVNGMELLYEKMLKALEFSI